MPLIERKNYLDRLIAWQGQHIIKVITGVRRCGKSTLLMQFREYLLGHGISADQIISINFEDFDAAHLKDLQTLHGYIKSHLTPGRMTYVFFDEIQQVDNFQQVINSLFLNRDIDIYLTGSNANLLSGELATLLTGRYVEIAMLPLSFSEFLSIGEHNTSSLEDRYRHYLETTSFPFAIEFNYRPQQVQEYLTGLYNTIIVKDMIGRKKINDSRLLEKITRFLFDSIGSRISCRKIADSLTSMGRKADAKTVERYVQSLEECFVLYRAERYDIKGKQLLKTLAKYYAVDIGLRRALLGTKSMNAGHILENVIYLELRRRGYRVYIGKYDDLEVDFVTENEKGTTYFQVSATVRDPATLERELRPLQKIRDNYPKCLLTLDNDPDTEYNGIQQINALRWLAAPALHH